MTDAVEVPTDDVADLPAGFLPPPGEPPSMPAVLTDAFTRIRARRASGDDDGAVIPEGGRNSTLASLAGSMRRRGHTEAEIVAALHVTNDGRCTPPLAAAEVEAIARSVGGYAPGATLAPVRPPVDRPDAEAAWQSLDLAAFLREPPPEPDWLLEGFVEHGEIVWLSGPGKVGKSMVALFLASAALSAAPGFLGTPVAPLDWALYVDGENSANSVRRRVHFAGMPIDVAAKIDYQSVRGVDLGAAEHLDVLARLSDRGGRGLVVLDSLIALHRADEDKAGEVRAFVTGLRAVAERSGVTMIGLAHENRGGNLRGSLDWRNAADTVLELRKDEAGVRTLKIGDRRNGAEDVSPRVFRFVPRDGHLLLETTGEGSRGGGAARPPSGREIMVGQLEAVLLADPSISKAAAARLLGTAPDSWSFRKAWQEVGSQLKPRE